MSGIRETRLWGAHTATAAAALLAVSTLTGCAGGDRVAARPEAQASAPPPAPAPPPVDLAGRWKLTAASGGGCFMNLGSSPGALQGTIAPEGGCPGSFFTSRKWTFEHDALIIRNHKGEPLAQLSFAGGRFEGREPSGTALSLSR
jgi:Protease inhibitor Inh